MSINIHAATITVEVDIDAEDLTPSFRVGVEIHDSTFSFIAKDPELIPTWLNGVATQIRKQITSGEVNQHDAPPDDPERHALAQELEERVKEKQDRDEADVLASIQQAIADNGGTA